MLCNKVLKLLSGFYDDALDSDTSFQISQHLDQCKGCRKELDSISSLHGTLRSLTPVPTPQYLFHLIQLRIADKRQDSWRTRMKDALELCWSRIRTTEGMWYWTRALGTITAVAFFCLINVVTPYYMEVNSPRTERVTLAPYGEQVIYNIVGKLGMLPAEASKRQVSKNNPAISDRYLLNFGQCVAHTGEDDTLTVVTAVDPNGIAKIQDVLVYPSDQTLLSSFSKMIATVPFRPGSINGKAVPSQMVLTFNRISVSD